MVSLEPEAIHCGVDVEQAVPRGQIRRTERAERCYPGILATASRPPGEKCSVGIAHVAAIFTGMPIALFRPELDAMGTNIPNRSLIRVLIVDDHPLVRAGVKVLLAEGGGAHVVGEAADGQTALVMAEAHRPDVVLMDCLMPGISGVEATKMLLAAHPWVKVLGFSSLDDLDGVRQLLDAGAAGYARKGSTAAELARALRTVADGGRYLAPQLASALSVAQRRQADDEVRLASLSRREAEVLRGIAQGRPAKEVAGALAISPRTLETYRQRAMNKLELDSRTELIRCAVRFGWLLGD